MNVGDPRSSSPPTTSLANRPDAPPTRPAAEPPKSLQQPQLQKPKIVIPSRDPGALNSGGGISFLNGNKNARFSYGYSSFKGKRSSMEDFFETKVLEVDGQMVAFFGVFDGHGGSRTAEYLKNNLFKNLSSHPDFIKDTKSAIVESFRQTDADYINEEKGQQKDAGSTASTAVLLGDRLLVANVGDSRVVACRAGSAVPLSVDHKPDRSDERERIEQAGGFIIWAVSPHAIMPRANLLAHKSDWLESSLVHEASVKRGCLFSELSPFSLPFFVTSLLYFSHYIFYPELCE
ncbi:probable protein phosphatase 2C 11 isoform X3 [Diospyros lotus]|uniref:probable protein phosphatase 2C 11 isoform X3 n=1 Tax=Diospyros lotus TaxID=55363 RepID=UPI0022533E57|nr:probable protein phosphatase 2C 11 isoform X3 [Diospyros lotus]